MGPTHTDRRNSDRRNSMFSQEPGSSRSSNSSIASGATAHGKGLITNGKKELGHLKGRIDYVRGTNLRGAFAHIAE